MKRIAILIFSIFILLFFFSCKKETDVKKGFIATDISKDEAAGNRVEDEALEKMRFELASYIAEKTGRTDTNIIKIIIKEKEILNEKDLKKKALKEGAEYRFSLSSEKIKEGAESLIKELRVKGEIEKGVYRSSGLGKANVEIEEPKRSYRARMAAIIKAKAEMKKILLAKYPNGKEKTIDFLVSNSEIVEEIKEKKGDEIFLTVVLELREDAYQ